MRRLERLDAPPRLIDLTRKETSPGLQAGIQCQVYKQDYPGPEQLNHLVFDAFSDSLGGRIPANNGDCVRALEQWYKAHFPGDASLAENSQESFRTFLAQLRRDNPQVDLQNAPVVNLVRQYWQFLDQQQDQPRGRRSPAG